MDQLCETAGRTGASPAASPPRPLRIGLVNAMPDAACRSAEVQFATLLEAAAGPRGMTLVPFSLDGVPRGPATAARMAQTHLPCEAVPGADLDALVVTGAEPRRADLREEAFWPAMARLVDWAARTGTPSLWSCLAAHAAVKRLDGIERRRLPSKCSGVFGVLDGSGRGERLAPHSRHNALEEADLARCGYRVLTRSPEAGVDSFTRGDGRFLFHQGHPEYDADTLSHEYRRDLLRHLAGEQDTSPTLPQHYFAPEAEPGLTRRAIEAKAAHDPSLVAAALNQAPLRHPAAPWRLHAAPLHERWLQTAAPSATPPTRRAAPL